MSNALRILAFSSVPMTILQNELPKEQKERLFHLALTAKENAYTPYSKFRVGACLLTEEGDFIQGCNVENASYGATICAERTAFVKAISNGHRKFKALAVSTDQLKFVSPCGICRLVISEFTEKEMPVYFLNKDGQYKQVNIQELLPFAFSGDDM